jgi:Mrp family chromosome partitioning ATPase
MVKMMKKQKISREEAKKRLMALIAMKNKQKLINEKMDKIKYKIGIISGKGGVGKSTVTAYIAIGLRYKGYKVGIVDSDFHGPTIPKLLGVEDEKIKLVEDNRIIPVVNKDGIKIISIHYFLDDPSTAIIWRGPLKKTFLEDILAYTDFGELDYLLFDLPPGCLPKDTIIYKYPGEQTTLSSLKKGDYIYSFNGDICHNDDELIITSSLSKSKVLDIIPQGVHDIYEVKTETKRLRGTANHPILTAINLTQEKNKYYSLAWIPIKRLKRGDVIVVSDQLTDSTIQNGLFEENDRYFKLEKITEIRYVGKEEVYDIKTDNLHNFIANGIVVHNTGDEALNLIQTVPTLTGLIAVTQPTTISSLTVAKSIDFSIRANVKMLGIIENMSGFVCPDEGKVYNIFYGNGGEILSKKFNIPLLGKLPIDPRLSEAAEKGVNIMSEYPNSKFSREIQSIVDKLIEIIQ